MGRDKNCGIGEDCGEGVYAGLICGRGSCFSSVGREGFVGRIRMVLCYSGYKYGCAAYASDSQLFPVHGVCGRWAEERGKK